MQDLGDLCATLILSESLWTTVLVSSDCLQWTVVPASTRRSLASLFDDHAAPFFDVMPFLDIVQFLSFS